MFASPSIRPTHHHSGILHSSLCSAAARADRSSPATRIGRRARSREFRVGNNRVLAVGSAWIIQTSAAQRGRRNDPPPFFPSNPPRTVAADDDRETTADDQILLTNVVRWSWVGRSGTGKWGQGKLWREGLRTWSSAPTGRPRHLISIRQRRQLFLEDHAFYKYLHARTSERSTMICTERNTDGVGLDTQWKTIRYERIGLQTDAIRVSLSIHTTIFGIRMLKRVNCSGARSVGDAAAPSDKYLRGTIITGARVLGVPDYDAWECCGGGCARPSVAVLPRWYKTIITRKTQ